MDLGLAGKTAVVLGATSGLGWATARDLDAEGANVVVVGRDAERVSFRAGQLRSAVGVVADLTQPTAADHIVDATREAFGAAEVLVLNGGGPPPGSARDFSPTALQASLDLLLAPHIALVQKILPRMTERGWGRIIAIGSSGVQAPLPMLAASNVGRAALAAYLKTLANEVAPLGVTVNMVLPGRIATDRVAQLDQATADRTGASVDSVRERSRATIPAGRYGSPEEFAALVVFLASERASYITGEQVRCDGGLLRST